MKVREQNIYRQTVQKLQDYGFSEWVTALRKFASLSIPVNLPPRTFQSIVYSCL